MRAAFTPNLIHPALSLAIANAYTMDKRERPRGFFEAFITVSGGDNRQKDNKVSTNNN
jgi:hypothetical protein